ncbi:MAG TPA: DegT/DnrJ/EryC1/StrS family aminotransferase [Fervidobacterium sp.]|nr:DegT/DnrJ/EryC1/StrS family aminotransferase [Fervidobacterium sp.]
MYNKKGGVVVIVEIGSDWAITFDPHVINLENTGSHRFAIPSDYFTVLTDSGRSAMRLALKCLGLVSGDSMLVPAYVCESMLSPLNLEGIRPIFYPVGSQFDVSLENIVERKDDAKAILVVDFFGFSSSLREDLSELSSEGLMIIYDMSHSLINTLDNPNAAVDAYVGSLRKILPVPDGGIVLLRQTSSNSNFVSPKGIADHSVLRVAAMILKEAWLKQPFAERPNFRELFLKSEDMLDRSVVVAGPNPVTEVLLPLLDLDYLVSARQANYADLLSYSENWGSDIRPVFGLPGKNECPLGFPIRCSRRDELREFLIAKKIYPPVHWILDKTLFSDFPTSLSMSEEILTIPCDHRYGATEMEYIDQVVSEWVGYDV